MNKDILSHCSAYGISLSVFGTEERAIIEKGIQTGAFESLAAMIHHMTPGKEAEIQKIMSAFMPRVHEFDLASQKEAEAFYATNPSSSITPEKEAELQKKIDAERAQKLKDMGLEDGEDMKERVLNENENPQVTITNNKTTIKVPFPATVGIADKTNLTEIEGLGPKSIHKLVSNGVLSKEAFEELSFDKKQLILGAVVAAKFKDIN